MHAQHVAGLSLGIARNGTRLYLRGYGLRDATAGEPADGFTIYRAGSIAKQFTAAIAMQQVAAGHVALDAPANSYVAMPLEGSHEVTIAQLLGQTSGITAASGASAMGAAFDPGTGWAYSNANYDLVGMALQTVTGVAYPTLLRGGITAPFSLFSTGCAPSPFARNLARGYLWAAGWKPAPPFLGGNAGDGCASTGLLSNAADLIRWLEDLRSGRIVSQQSFATMTATGRLANGVATHYGFGFFVANWFGYTVAEHPGYTGGFSGDDALVLQSGLEVAVLSNADAVDLTPLVRSIVAILDEPLDPNLSASANLSPQNENLRITAALKAAVQTSRYAAFGALESAEFVERSIAGSTTYDKYRLTFSSGQWWAIVGYGAGGAIESLSLTPVE